MSPLLSVIIPVHNRAAIVTATLDSVYRQDYRPIELLAVDNNSTDNSLEVLTDWAKRHSCAGFNVSVLSEPQSGAAAARNKGLETATAPYVMFFDSDDIMEPGHIMRAMQTFTDDPSLDIVGWDICNIGLDGHRTRLPFADRDMRYRHTFNAVLSTARYALKTDLIRKAGGWDDTLPAWNDYELGMRLIMLAPKIKRLCGKCTVTVRQSTESITGCDYSSRHEHLEKSLDRCEAVVSGSGDNRWLKYIRLKRVVLAGLYAREKSPEARRLLNLALDKEPSPIKKLLLIAAFRYTAAGGRGIHRLLRKVL